MNRKAIMLKFLVTVLLAILIFAPACVVSSKILRFGPSQAEDNFNQFVKEIKDLAENGEEGAMRSFIMILDKRSLVRNFWPSNLDRWNRCVTGKIVEEQWKGPGALCNGQDCICLFQGYEKGTVVPQEAELCKKDGSLLEYVVEITPKETTCKLINGFYIYQLPEGYAHSRIGENSPRRINIGMVKKGNVIYICQDPPCTIPTNPEVHS